jgi:hypothetical protein
MNVLINFTALLEGELLKPDGSNYIDWYECLRVSLKQYGAFFMIIEPLGQNQMMMQMSDTSKMYLLSQTLLLLFFL